MKTKIIIPGLSLVLLAGMYSCKKDPNGIMETGAYIDTAGPLKAAAGFPIGFAIDYTPMKNDPRYAATVAREGNSVTFGYQMKHGAVVRDNGSFDWTRTDELVNLATGAGLQIFGHTLGWHQNQNANYLKNFAGIVLPASVELLANGGFESGTTNLANWATYNAQNGATISVGAGAGEVRTGTRSMKVVNPVANPGNQWRVQVASDLFNTVIGTQYTVTYWVKAAAGGGSIRLSTQTSGGGSAQYQGDQNIGTTFQQITWTFTANSPQTRILFDMGQAANTYYIDDASVKEVIGAPSGTQIAAKLDQALGNFITAMVNRYKDKVKEWDVVNELFADDGNIRNNTNTSVTPTDVLVWSHYMGRDYALKAFNYAKAADPTALLYINDYNLESQPAKLDSLIAFVNELKGKGAKVDGIGTQMHIGLNTSFAGIDAAFQKLAATGLKIRISELDVRINPTDKPDLSTSRTMNAYQAHMYDYVISSYLKHVPPAQRAGITIWGVTDADSWIVTVLKKKDYPMLFDANYAKKPAYSGVLQALKGQ
ncbi:MAG TPA: endo-1,4-beta-xylanase [Chitinophagaceae bacterium]|nr:endo-1,4-beta-xylanase [Chitinophagaceae bacterium]